MSARLLTPGLLKDLSESRLSELRYRGTVEQRRVVRRLLDEPTAYRRWGTFHYSLMCNVVEAHSHGKQLARLRQTRLALLHGQALFEHLTSKRVTGRKREILFAAFRGRTDYTRGIITEHRKYLQANSSLFCADHLELEVWHDGVFTSAFAAYRREYMEYLSLYCDWVIADSTGADYGLRVLALQVKHRLAGVARRILALPEYQPERRATGKRH
ncbi:MAG: hypothetical protein ABI567_10895 [Gammaproteobacteria bacterium]